MPFVVLGLGSNRPWQGMDSIELLQKACAALAPLLGNMRHSSVYSTKPMYVEYQSDFYNMAVCGQAEKALTPRALLSEIHRIEAGLGRNRAEEIRNGPRSMDIDIELFGSERILEPDLEIPHPRLAERAFVLIPMLEILSESADCIERGMYAGLVQKARLVGTEGVMLYMSAADFAASGALPVSRVEPDARGQIYDGKRSE